MPLLDLDDEFFQKKSTETLTKEIANLCTEKFIKSPKNGKYTKQINVASNCLSISLLNSQWTEKKKDFSRAILQKIGANVLHKRGSVSCTALD